MTQEKNKLNQFIEIPFGAQDSELIEWECVIPKGMKAEIKDGKVIIKKKESEDKRIIEQIKFAVMQMPSEREDTKKECLAWLEKQKEQEKCPEYCVRSHCIGCSIYEKQKEQKPRIRHKNPY